MHWHITVIVKKITSIVVGIFVILVMSMRPLCLFALCPETVIFFSDF